MNTWSIKKKLGMMIAIIIISFVALTVFLLSRQTATTSELQRLYEKDYQAASMIGQIDGLLTRVDINILRMIAIGDPASIAGWKSQNTENFTKVEGLLSKLKAIIDPTMAQSFDGLVSSYTLMRKGMEHQVQAVESGDMKNASEINKNEVKGPADKTFGELSALKKYQDELANKKVVEQQSSDVTTRIISLLAAGIVALGSVILGTMILRSLLRQLGGEPMAAAQVVNRMAQGDLSGLIPVKDNDQFSLIAQLNEMQSSLSGIVTSVRSNAESLATASIQISQGNQDLSQRTEEQASALQQTSATMEQLGSTVSNNAENARQANQLALGASTLAAEGGSMVGRVIETMKGINDSSKKISDIINVIDSIAFQTNILALNAAVEAARAGEQGRGFAVVASEVRNLAQRSANAAKEISTLINNSVVQVEQGSRLVDETGVTMTQIVAAINQVTDIVSEISASSLEQSSGVKQVGQAITQIDTVTQQNAALVEESAAAAENLKEQAQQLVQAVAVFQVASNAAQPRLFLGR
ncbi:Methyl-accepting chemotaxis protein III [Dickeya dianthicola]|uniref:Cellobiose phosphorylase n=3 Tax=Dickeya dianthicola TaxID=204039 RepID=A0AAP6VDC7_9GAMM|nr:methyl-accepting chemotaxis protein [Dickeya dianthicola]ATO33253.1 Methyl-accepting chemotaxis protein I (serin chemoreceptor protein) [Dickeya dianthicola RNS04.9]AYC19154.1 Methyl-accepting chemotaxis protein III [Dickeya dianthicola]MBI0439002.1 cellobiose phosphorylase [Dickeya dianthicola]MBI0451028.1 cellobiose phosphorylase [Dickeya dianthicola]MBI0453806.1 cellobiose phosphorylase [Dickeya dianthicola]